MPKNSDIQDALHSLIDAIVRASLQRISVDHADGPGLLNQQGAADYLGVSLSKFKQMSKTPGLRPVRLEGMPRWKRTSLDAFIDKCEG